MLLRLLATFLIAAFAVAIPTVAASPEIQQPTLIPQNSGTTNGLIAVSPVNPQVVWASGRAGTFVVTTDGGNTWKAGVVPGAELLQFRDVEGVSAGGRVSAVDRCQWRPYRFSNLQNGRWRRDLDYAVPEPESQCVLRLLRILDTEARHLA